MDINRVLIEQNIDRDKQIHGIFASLFILQNRLQTIFDKLDPNITIKQLMMLIIIKLSEPNQTFTHYAKILGCSRQNIKKLVTSLENKNFIEIKTDDLDKRKNYLLLTDTAEKYFNEFSLLHSEQLNLLFSNYSDEEVALFYSMIAKLYSGVENMETGLWKKIEKWI